METQHDLDEMVARHDARHNGAHDVKTGYLAPDEETDPLVRRAKILVHLSAGHPRNVWPKGASAWNAADRAERHEWVRKLYQEQGLTVKSVAERMGLSDSVVQHDVITLGIARGGAPGKDTVKQRRKAERLKDVRRLFEDEGRSAQDIADILGVSESTVHQDIKDNALKRGRPRLADKQVTQVVDRAVTELGRMAQLLLEQDGVDALVVEEKQASDWERQLKLVGRAVGRVRRAMKGDTQ